MKKRENAGSFFIAGGRRFFSHGRRPFSGPDSGGEGREGRGEEASAASFCPEEDVASEQAEAFCEAGRSEEGVTRAGEETNDAVPGACSVPEKVRRPFILRRLKRHPVLAAVSLFLLLFFFLFFVNQALLFARLFSFGNLVLERWMALFLFLIAAGLFLWPLLYVLRWRPRSLMPRNPKQEGYEDRLAESLSYLKKNRYLIKSGFTWGEERRPELELARAHRVLAAEARRLIKREAGSVFISTAVSQNGALDAFFVLSSLLRMIYRLAKLYQNRPSWRELLQIYWRIAVVMSLSRGMEDLSLIEEQIDALSSALLGGTLFSVLPGTAAISNLFLSSVAEASVNTLLTLRVGLIASKLFSTCRDESDRGLRRQASVEACGIFLSLLKDSTSEIMQALGRSLAKVPRKLWRREF